MSLPSVERTASGWPASSDASSSGAIRVLPVAPVNPTVSPSPPLEPTPSVVNHVSPAMLQGKMPTAPNEGQPVYTSVPDPMKNGASGQQIPHDWTMPVPAPANTQSAGTAAADATPNSQAVSQALMDNLKTMWNASANAVQAEQVQNQLNVTPPSQLPVLNGNVAKDSLVYQPGKIKRSGKI